jgi:hypothetical protein
MFESIKGMEIVIEDGKVFEIERETCAAVIYHGEVRYLTNAERCEVIRGGGSDFDVVPKDFEPKSKEIVKRHRIELCRPYYVIQEWDGTEDVVLAHIGHDIVKITYRDGVTHTISKEEFILLKPRS